MEMSIEHVNKLLSVITAAITEDDDCFTIEDENLQVFKEALLIAIDTVHKYQKIKDIVKDNNGFTNGTLEHSKAFTKIAEVIEDGNYD